MQKIIALLDGKKSYLVAIAVASIAGAQALGYQVPEWVYALLGAAGLGSVRSAIDKQG
jgi:hypothetical protein